MRNGDQVIGKYYERTLADPERYIYPDIASGIERMMSGTNVIRVDEGGLKAYLKNNPLLKDNLHIFGEARPFYPGIIFRKTSPLAKVFQSTVQRLRERGTLYQLRTIWEGRYMKKNTEGTAEAEVFGPGQALTAFAFMVLALCLSAVLLCFELQWKRRSTVIGESIE